MTIHPSVAELTDSDSRRMKSVLRTSFAIAGCLWIVAYTLHFSSSDVMTAFRLDQYQIYLVLLTLWGYQAKREAKRFAVLMRLSTESDIAVASVTSERIDESGDLGAFDVFVRRSNGSWFPVVFTWFLLGAFLLLLVKQMYLLFGSAA